MYSDSYKFRLNNRELHESLPPSVVTFHSTHDQYATSHQIQCSHITKLRVTIYIFESEYVHIVCSVSHTAFNKTILQPSEIEETSRFTHIYTNPDTNKETNTNARAEFIHT
jgi:hypothetical protein